MLVLCSTILLANLWAIFAMLTTSSRPPYTFADWRKASDRIYQEMCRLQSAPEQGSPFNRRACRALLRDLLANTAFILNVVNDSCRGPSRRHLNRPELVCYTRDVMSQSAALLLRLHCARLQLFFWPHASSPRWCALAVGDGYLRLCLALAAFLERYVYCKAGGSCPREAQTAP
jgi:hypothetical protein